MTASNRGPNARLDRCVVWASGYPHGFGWRWIRYVRLVIVLAVRELLEKLLNIFGRKRPKMFIFIGGTTQAEINCKNIFV